MLSVVDGEANGASNFMFARESKKDITPLSPNRQGAREGERKRFNILKFRLKSTSKVE